MYAAGLRVSEICGLKLRDVQEREEGAGQITVYAKGGKTRGVLLSTETWDEMNQNFLGRVPSGGRVPEDDVPDAFRGVRIYQHLSGLKNKKTSARGLLIPGGGKSPSGFSSWAWERGTVRRGGRRGRTPHGGRGCVCEAAGPTIYRWVQAQAGWRKAYSHSPMTARASPPTCLLSLQLSTRLALLPWGLLGMEK